MHCLCGCIDFKQRQKDLPVGCSDDGCAMDIPQRASDLFVSFPFTDARVNSFLQTLAADAVEPDTVNLVESPPSGPVVSVWYFPDISHMAP